MVHTVNMFTMYHFIKKEMNQNDCIKCFHTCRRLHRKKKALKREKTSTACSFYPCTQVTQQLSDNLMIVTN